MFCTLLLLLRCDTHCWNCAFHVHITYVTHTDTVTKYCVLHLRITIEMSHPIDTVSSMSLLLLWCHIYCWWSAPYNLLPLWCHTYCWYYALLVHITIIMSLILLMECYLQPYYHYDVTHTVDTVLATTLLLLWYCALLVPITIMMSHILLILCPHCSYYHNDVTHTVDTVPLLSLLPLWCHSYCWYCACYNPITVKILCSHCSYYHNDVTHTVDTVPLLSLLP